MQGEKKMGPTEYQQELGNLVRAGKFPTLEEVLAAVAETRAEYVPKILVAREQGEDE